MKENPLKMILEVFPKFEHYENLKILNSRSKSSYESEKSFENNNLKIK